MISVFSFHLLAELTNRCNLSCLHCFRMNNIEEKPDLPLVVYEKLLKEARSYHSSHITLTGGGEPTLHREFEMILAITAKYNYKFTLVTNGSTFEQIYPLLMRYKNNVHSVFLSLDGAKEATHNAIRGHPGLYQSVIKASMMCFYKQIPFQLSMTLHRLNVTEIDDLLLLASKLGADAVNIGSALLTRILVEKDLALSPQERKQIRTKLIATQEHAPVPVNLAFDIFVENPCVACPSLRMSTLVLDYMGRVRFCCQLSGYEADQGADIIGDLHDTSVWECHRRLVRKIAEFQEEKITRVEARQLTEQDHFPCHYCTKYFGKLGWLTDFPDSPWNYDAE